MHNAPFAFAAKLHYVQQGLQLRDVSQQEPVANVLQTKVDNPCDKLATKLS